MSCSYNFYVFVNSNSHFVEWLPRRDRVTYDRYRAHTVVVKRAVKVAKRMADLEMGRAIGGIISRVTKIVLERGKASDER